MLCLKDTWPGQMAHLGRPRASRNYFSDYKKLNYFSGDGLPPAPDDYILNHPRRVDDHQVLGHRMGTGRGYESRSWRTPKVRPSVPLVRLSSTR